MASSTTILQCTGDDISQYKNFFIAKNLNRLSASCLTVGIGV